MPRGVKRLWQRQLHRTHRRFRLRQRGLDAVQCRAERRIRRELHFAVNAFGKDDNFAVCVSLQNIKRRKRVGAIFLQRSDGAHCAHEILEFGELAVIAVGLRSNAFQLGDLRQCNIHVCILSKVWW